MHPQEQSAFPQDGGRSAGSGAVFVYDQRVFTGLYLVHRYDCRIYQPVSVQRLQLTYIPYPSLYFFQGEGFQSDPQSTCRLAISTHKAQARHRVLRPKTP